MYRIYKDGDAWCAVCDDFVNLQESEAGFGNSAVESLKNLLDKLADLEILRCDGMRNWLCENCGARFSRGLVAAGSAPDCIRCKAGNQSVREILFKT